MVSGILCASVVARIKIRYADLRNMLIVKTADNGEQLVDMSAENKEELKRYAEIIELPILCRDFLSESHHQLSSVRDRQPDVRKHAAADH